jgi:allophanate hydrolase
MLATDESLDIARLGPRLRTGELRPSEVAAAVLRRIKTRGDDKVWIHRVADCTLMAMAAALEKRGPQGLPLYGLPFAIKDNIDLAGHPTTAACPEYAYLPNVSATVVERLLAAGALPVGKTNLDQFATGLVGTRSPYGACANAFDERYIAGGSSSGSAVAVAAGLVSFALGTDTAGSGRVPAAFNNVIGLKPTRGLISARGVVPACRSLDCVSIFALTAADAAAVLRVAKGFDAADPFARREPQPIALAPSLSGCRIGVPRGEQLDFFGNDEAARLFWAAAERLKSLGAVCVEVDFAPFLAAARLLYEGPWIAERYLAIREYIERRPEALHPTTREIIGGGAGPSAVDCFAGYYRLRELRRAAGPTWAQIDVLLTPTAGRIYTIAEVLADPIRLNSQLGTYTNFVNLMDLCAIAVPAGMQREGLPFGVTLVAPAWADEALCRLADAWHRAVGVGLGASEIPLPPASREEPCAGDMIPLVVCGGHMSGLPLNAELTERGGIFLRRCRTAPHYRLFALEQFIPPRPGLTRDAAGNAIEVEVWALPSHALGSFVDSIPSPLAIGTIELEDGETLRGFLCEGYAVARAPEITALGGWRAYLRQGRIA